MKAAGAELPQRALDATANRRERLWARCQRRRLDRALAAGVDPRVSPLLASRADALGSRRERDALASTLYRLLKDARRDHSPFSVRVPIAREAIEQNRFQLLEIAAVLRQDASVGARGVATIGLLVSDGSSPLYHPAAPAALRAALFRARCWL